VPPTFASGKPPRRQRREHIGTGKSAETLLAVCPLYVTDYELPEMTSGEVEVYGGDDCRREWAQDEAW
jgi:hypothetical protein